MLQIQVPGSALQAVRTFLVHNLPDTVGVGVELPHDVFARQDKDDKKGPLPYVRLREIGEQSDPQYCVGGKAKAWQRRPRIEVQTWGSGRNSKDRPVTFFDPCTDAPFLEERAETEYITRVIDGLAMYGAAEYMHRGVLLCGTRQISGPRWQPDPTCGRSRFISSYEFTVQDFPCHLNKPPNELTLI